jgi:dienelactone hydrolase
MAQIALFHSVLGVRPGVLDAAERLRAVGHDVRVVDQYDGRVFDDYEEAAAHVESVGFPALMQRAVDAVADLPDGFVVVGFSNGAGMAEYVATQRRVSGVVMLSGTLPLAMIGADAWPAGVPAQIHYSTDDPNRSQEWLDDVVASIRAAGVPLDLHDDYENAGHLFTDASLPREYDAESAELLWKRVLGFVNDR